MAIVESEVRKWFDVFHSETSLAEIRILGDGKRTYSGYFTNVDLIISSISKYDKFGIYSVVNEIKTSCYDRKQKDVIIESPINTTGDPDIEGRSWLFIDIDPIRPAGINATDEEKGFAYKVMVAIGEFLRDNGFSAPIVIDSANGYHLYYRVNLENSEENRDLINTFLKVLDMFFSTSKAEVDLTVFNASRIAKLPGTYSAKGSNSQNRPKRLCKFIRVQDKVTPTDKVFIKKVASLMPIEETPSRFNGYSSEKFDVHSFLSNHGINVIKTASFKGGQKLILENCPFNHDHKAPDSAIFIMQNGAIGFKCLHNSCSQYTWRDLRIKLDPQAYQNRDREIFSQKQNYYSTEKKAEPTIIAETEEKGKKWLSMTDIKYIDPSSLTYIPTGIKELDRKIGGLALGDVSIMSGIAGSGKTSMLNFIILNAIQRGYKGAVWSGELQDWRFQSWINQVAAGKNYVYQKVGYQQWYYCPRDVAMKINAWLDGKLFLYNNLYGNKWSQLQADIEECVETNGTQLVILDNLASMNLDSLAGDKNDKQSRFIAELKNYAKIANIHVLQVIHPRKELSNTLLRMESLSGSADLYNLVDNVFLNHRVGVDFQRRAKEFFGQEETDRLMEFNEVMEIAKNRTMGIMGDKIGLYFEVESRRFKNTKDEYLVYGWQETPKNLTLDMYDDYSDMPSYTETEEDDDMPF